MASQRNPSAVRRGTATAHLDIVEGYGPAPVPIEPSGLDALREAAAGCKACDLYRNATQTVFGEGRERAWLMLVGEQPGDREDQTGAPFVGPAGELLDRALEDAGIDRRSVYVTNVVKHFKWKPRGKRRIHQKPNREEIDACRPWLDAELKRVEPRAIVCLGATAAQALIDRSFRVTQQHGELRRSSLGPPIGATVHPSSVLRSSDSESRHTAYAGLVADLERIAAAVRG
jgi:uracil-DNA glycosylase family protein